MPKRKSSHPELINKETDGQQWLLWSSGKYGQATATPYNEPPITQNHRDKYTRQCSGLKKHNK